MQKTIISFSGFSKLNQKQRFLKLLDAGALTHEEIAYLEKGGVPDAALAETCIENALGYFQMPLGLATNMVIDGEALLIPMAIEETSVIAALSKAAKWIKEKGHITTSIKGVGHIGQMQIAHPQNIPRICQIILAERADLMRQVNETILQSMVQRGGGLKEIQLRQVPHPHGHDMLIIHLIINTCDAMGANRIAQVTEFLKVPIEQLTGETINMCILSNLSDTLITKAVVEIANVSSETGTRIEEGSFFAESDPYRAATHNKGILNGMDAVILATGNDWRAVGAGLHAYAARGGTYQPLSTWRYEQGILRGELKGPIPVGTVGGVTALHPTARLALNLLKAKSAARLSQIIAAVGLVQNLAALKALTHEGIMQGHMRLHAKNMVERLGAQAPGQDRTALAHQLQQVLQKKKYITSADLKAMR